MSFLLLSCQFSVICPNQSPVSSSTTNFLTLVLPGVLPLLFLLPSVAMIVINHHYCTNKKYKTARAPSLEWLSRVAQVRRPKPVSQYSHFRTFTLVTFTLEFLLEISACLYFFLPLYNSHDLLSQFLEKAPCTSKSITLQENCISLQGTQGPQVNCTPSILKDLNLCHLSIYCPSAVIYHSLPCL